MGGRDGDSSPTIGFLSVVEHAQLGLVGGYLILNASGRPLEFHCTAPVKPSRAQQILYGPTLQPFLYGEQIGQTLLTKGAAWPAMVCTDVALALGARAFAQSPVALVLTQVAAVGQAQAGPEFKAAGSEAPGQPVASEAPVGKEARDEPPAETLGEPLNSRRMWRADRAHVLGENLNTFHLGRNHLAVLASEAGDEQTILERLASVRDFDLSEPFGRIHDAIDEAHKVGRA